QVSGHSIMREAILLGFGSRTQCGSFHLEVKMKRTHITLWPVMLPAIATLAFAAGAAAQTVVVGTGNADIDVPAVQAAVDQGGDVVLEGHFSFNRPPTVALPPVFPDNGYPAAAMVLVSKAVTISGVAGSDDRGDMTSIEGGTIPFYVEAPGTPVSIQRLRFVRPTNSAVTVFAVSGLVIASCKIDGVEPWEGFGIGLDIDTSAGPFLPGKPENVSGTVLIVNNDIDVAARPPAPRLVGLGLFYVGVTGAGVDANISGNRIRNFSERAIELR